MNNIINSNVSNVFTTLLTLLKVNHTKSASNKYYNEHPHKYDLYGISNMLSNYKIANAATTIENKEKDIFNIETPFIAHVGGDFVVVHEVRQEMVQYISNNLGISLPPNPTFTLKIIFHKFISILISHYFPSI